MADILLIYPQPEETKDARFGFSLRLLYLSAILKAAGHSVRLNDYSVEAFDMTALAEQLVRTDVAVIEFDSFPLKRAQNLGSAEALTAFVKQSHPQVKVIAFGYDCALFPRKVESADFTFTGEPEAAITTVVAALLAGSAVPDTLPSLLDNLDCLPFPDREMLSPFVEHGGSLRRQPHLAKSTLIQTSRGCRNRCRFCQRKGWDSAYREHSVDYSAREFAHLQERGYVNVWVADDNFGFHLPRAKALLTRLADAGMTRGMKIALSSWVYIDEEFLRLAKAASVSLISFGIETACPEIQAFYDKKIDLEKTASLLHTADKLGIYTVGNFIIGAPMETEGTMAQTFDYIRKVPLDQVNIKILDYMAGSDLYASLSPDVTAGRRHLFASLEMGLNAFPLKDLKARSNRFQQEIRALNQSRLRQKIARFGLPYETAGTLT
ncbi:radical SAM protein [Heliobacterium gestii]|uniref:Radical SAM protein n=1 Tax=Heliomicrobium gestii TaxID=2699 RepID=A0A845L4Y8_HELGE|nr:radical SAM protein [Heliomicrobium gestii]MBM7865387.1 radical SAM superfamily enzyme YgiQ (UPF0313 family) [Heliomicrobium gestii]MZP41647.1 radical SAM protein [Heliomicrobium gestii]